jgi:hypothetical protein
MASSTTTPKTLCVICNKGRGSFKCEGCLQTFCPKHSNDHRNELSKQFEEIETAHNFAQQTLIQQTEDPRQHPLLKKIDQWEKESVDKIRQAAEEARNELLKNTVQITANMKQKLKQLSDELRQARDDNDFIETDLQQWIQKIEELKKEVLHPEIIAIREDPTPLVNKICVDRQDKSDVFEHVCGDSQIAENGRVVMGGSLTGHTEIRGKNEYNTGRHTLQFRIEQLAQGKWVFFGIISKSTPMQNVSYGSSSSYGWSNRNQMFVAGQLNKKQTFEIVEKDTITLLIDCNSRKIELKNERSVRTQELPVDINKCPFPWQLHLNINGAKTHVRILNPLD